MPRTREQIEQAASDAEAWLERLDPAVFGTPEADASDLRAIAAATRAVADGTAEQTAAVGRARRNGKTWAEIAAVLGVSRQAATAKYGEPAELG